MGFFFYHSLMDLVASEVLCHVLVFACILSSFINYCSSNKKNNDDTNGEKHNDDDNDNTGSDEDDKEVDV